MKVNKTTMEFENLTSSERNALVELVDSILQGRVDWNSPLLQAWCVACGFEVNQGLMVASTVFPAKALRSVVRWDQDAIETLWSTTGSAVNYFKKG